MSDLIALILVMSQHHEKIGFCLCENKGADSCAVIVHLISAYVFALLIVQSLFYLNAKFQAISLLP